MNILEDAWREKILSFVEGRSDEQLQFVIDLGHQNSFSFNKAGTDAVASMILDRIGHLFPVHRVVEQSEVGDLHLLSTIREGESIYLLGHMDTVFPPDHPFQACHVDGDRLQGPGCGGMKAGLATIVYALLALEEVDDLRRIPLTVILAGDEEVGAVTSRPVYEEEREKAMACLVVEGGGANGEIVVSRNGKIGARMDCRGQDQHADAAEPNKASAILELAHKTIGLEALNQSFSGVRINVGQVAGGLGPATVPGEAGALIDVRWEDQAVRDELVERIQGVVSRTDLPGCTSSLSIMNERPAWPLTDGTQALAGVIRTVGAALGQSVHPEHRIGTSDSNFFGSAGVPTIDGLGPICEGYHTDEEFVYIPTIPERTSLVASSILAMNEIMK
jgi:glutamate carboxypeptidase